MDLGLGKSDGSHLSVRAWAQAVDAPRKNHNDSEIDFKKGKEPYLLGACDQGATAEGAEDTQDAEGSEISVGSRDFGKACVLHEFQSRSESEGKDLGTFEQSQFDSFGSISILPRTHLLLNAGGDKRRWTLPEKGVASAESLNLRIGLKRTKISQSMHSAQLYGRWDGQRLHSPKDQAFASKDRAVSSEDSKDKAAASVLLFGAWANFPLRGSSLEESLGPSLDWGADAAKDQKRWETRTSIQWSWRWSSKARASLLISFDLDPDAGWKRFEGGHGSLNLAL